jgi:pSer/pThr/pTyr-binding forkhead associated (FHA) protein
MTRAILYHSTLLSNTLGATSIWWLKCCALKVLQEDHGMEQTLIRSPHNMLVLRSLNGTDHPLSDVTLVGREAECQLQLIEGHASRYHAKLTVTGSQQVLVEDLKSTNGTFVNGQRVETPIVASLGDELRFDISRFRIATAQSGDAQATVFRDMARDRETMAPPQPTPRPAPQMMTPAPQQPDVVATVPATAVPAPTTARPTTVPTTASTTAPASEVPAAATPTRAEPLPQQSSAQRRPASELAYDIHAATSQPGTLSPSSVPPATASEGTNPNRTITASTPKKPVDDRVITGRTKPKKIAQFQTDDKPPATGTSSLPADELANLASKSSRTVRRLDSTAGPRLVVLNPPARGMIFPLADSGAVGEWLLGRGEDADVALADRTVSVRHAVIRKTGSRWEIENLNATNGVFVNGKLISRRVITTGDKVRLGRTEMQFRTDNDPGAEVAAASTPPISGLAPGMLLALAGAVFVALFVLILILVLQRGP